MCADARVLAEYQAKSNALREQINVSLWEYGFYRAFHYAEGENTAALFETHRCERPRELIGYIPWMLAIPTAQDA